MKMTENQKKLFAIAKFLDDARWSKPENYETIKGVENLTGRQQLLVHYLLYIMDRQMPFEIIWDKGGRVFSRIVSDYAMGVPVSDMLKLGGNYVNTTNIETKWKSIEFHTQDDDGKEISFKSRFVSTDFKSIYSTLYILDRVAGRDLVAFCEKVASSYKGENDVVKRIAYALHVMTYEHQAKKPEEDLEEYLSKIEQESSDLCGKIQSFLNKSAEDGYNHFCKEQTYSSKRLWCALRDYIKSPVYSKIFLPEINKVLEPHSLKEYTSQLELPGDVWNNNDNFVNCICPGKLKSTPFNKHLRTLVENDSQYEIDCFDVSFSLVPRVCQGRMDCGCCPFGLVKEREHYIENMCVANPDKWCPIVLYSTGYKMECKGKDKCELIKIAGMAH